jgi:hypothetical protein
LDKIAERLQRDYKANVERLCINVQRLLYNRFAINPPPLCNSFAIAPLSLRFRFAIVLGSKAKAEQLRNDCRVVDD